MHLPLEVPVFSAAAARTAIAHGAGRLEVNRAGSYVDGGLTPSLAEVAAVAAVVAGVDVPLRIMIRPRGPPPPGTGPDFVYSADEGAAMRGAIDAFVASGLLQAARGDGFVFGVLRADDDGRCAVDVDRNRQLVAAAAPYACVFHRAMDLVLAPPPPPPPPPPSGQQGSEKSEEAAATATAALAALHACRFSGVLTAGGPDPRGAAGHAPMLRRLVAAAPAAAAAPVAEMQHLEIVVGGGVRSGNAAALAQTVLCGPAGPVVFHASCLRAGTAAAAEEVDGDEVARLCTVLSGAAS